MSMFQLKEHGESGVHLEFAQERVIVQQLIAEQEIIPVAQCHAQAMLQKWQLVAKVRQYVSMNKRERTFMYSSQSKDTL